MDKERITISINKEVLSMIDSVIDGINVRNRSHAIESLTSKALAGDQSKNAVVVLGGDDALKQLPRVTKIIKQLEKSGYKKVHLAVGYLADKIKAKLSAEDFRQIKIDYLTKGEGSAGAILPLKKSFSNTFLVINSPESADFDISLFNNFHKKHKALATAATSDLEHMHGFYLFEPKIFDYIPKGFSMLESDVLPKLLKDNALIVYPLI